MLVVNVGINSEKSLQNGFGYQHEILRKRNTYALKKRKLEKKNFSLVISLDAV